MTKGVETNNKRYKHIKRDDEKWLFKYLYESRETIEKYINSLKPYDENQINKPVKKTMTITRIISILLLGVFGLITFITGIISIIRVNYVIGIPITIFGIVFLVAFYLNEKY